MSTVNNNVEKHEYYTLSHQIIDRVIVETLLSPVIIVGSPRSGTTWLQRLLLENRMICGGQESNFFPCFNNAFLSVKERGEARNVGLTGYWEVEEFNHQMRELWVRTFLSVYRHKPQATVLLEKTPSHALYLDTISDFLPKTKFIHLIRDSRAVISSFNAAAKGWGSYWAPESTKKAAIEWYLHVRGARKSNVAQDSDRYMEVHYEDLLTDPVSEMTRIFSFIGLSVNENDIREAIERQAFSKQKKEGGSGLKTSAGIELKEPEGFFRKGVADSWKDDLNIFQKLIVWRYTRKLMKELGYNWHGRDKQ